jgi:hypothetical protein
MRFVYTSKRLGKKYITPKEENDEPKLVSKFSMEIGGGASYAYRTLSGDGKMLRNESEKANVGLLTAVKINYHINTKWSVQSGLTIENRNEAINYNQTELKDKLTETSRQVTVFHPVLPPRTITVIDSSYSKEKVNYKFNTTNKYQTLNIPLVLGYNFTIGKLQYRISAGPVFNVYSMNTANNLVRINDNIELVPYKESAKIKSSAYTAFALQYPLNQNYAWITEISYYTNFSNRLNSDATLSQKNSGFNLFTGIKFNISK